MGEALAGWAWQHGYAACASVYWALIGRWLWNLFRHGPQLGSWGFWAGMEDAEVCARLSPGSQVSDWLVLPGRCASLIDRHFQAFLVAVHTTLYIMLCITALRTVLRHWERRHFMREYLALSSPAVQALVAPPASTHASTSYSPLCCKRSPPS